MSATKPRVNLRMYGTPPRIAVDRINIDSDSWDDIVIAIGDDSDEPGSVLNVRADSIVNKRRVLQGVLRRHGISLTADEAVQGLLAAANRDSSSLRAALSGQPRMKEYASAEADGDLSGTVSRFTRKLRPFQSRDLARLLELSHGANFSVPGAGKTTVTYALSDRERRAGRVDRLLVVAPLSAFGAWQEEAAEVHEPALELARWHSGPIRDADIVLINYQRLAAAMVPLTIWMAQHSVHLVVDEAHRAKRGATGEWGRTLLDIAPFAARRDILTGTPAPNHPRDLTALLDILWPGGEISRAMPRQALRSDPPMEAMAQVNQMLQPLYVRTTKRELELPAVKITPVIVRQGSLQRDIYDAMLSRYAGMFDLDRRDGAMFAQMGEVAMYLLQAASSPRLLSQGADPGKAYRYPPLAIPPGSRLAQLVDTYADHEVPPKISHACSIARDNALSGEKTLIWSNFPDNLLDLEQQLSLLQPALVYGAIPSIEDAPDGVRTRERELDRFHNDPNCFVLLANPAAMAEGVSLHHTCHHAVYIDRTFNAGQYLQSLDRIHRLGLDPNTTTRITLLMTEGTIDERVNRRVTEKTRRLSGILADRALVQMALPDDEDYGAPVDDPADLEEILRHLRINDCCS